MSTPDWRAPWVDDNPPSAPYDRDELISWLSEHHRYDGLICCHINVHRLGLDSVTQERVFEHLNDPAFLDYTGFSYQISVFEQEHRGTDVSYYGRSGTHVCLNMQATDTTYYELDELIQLYELVIDFDYAVQDACRAVIHWVNTYEIMNGLVRMRNPDDCEDCKGRGYELQGLNVVHCDTCCRYATLKEAERAVYPNEAIQVVICCACREPFGQVERVMACPKCQVVQRVP